MANKVLTHNLSEPLEGATRARVDINTGTGNLMIDRLPDGEPLLASGTLEYLLNEGLPTQSVIRSSESASLTLKAKGGSKSWVRLPWSSCNAATDWLIHLNPAVSSDLTAHSGGGNIKLDLADMSITRVSTDSGGGNIDMVLPDKVADLCASARTGAGNVVVELGRGSTGKNTLDATSGAGNVVIRVPGGLAARIHLSTGMGKAVVDPRFVQLDKNTYESLGYDSAADKVEITAKSGAGDVSVSTK